MQANKHLLLWTSLVTLALLVFAAARENVFKEWRRVQSAASGPAGPIDVHLRQVVVPTLAVADRCVTCHVGMAAGEPVVAGDPTLKRHPEVGHDPNVMGCTACHAGQGRATEKAAAHGDVHFWPTPMIPLRYADAGCGGCHTHIAVPTVDRLAAGERAFERNDCLACHKLDGRGGTLRPLGAGGMEGPDLSFVGARAFRADWYDAHLARRTEARGARAESDGEARGGAWDDSFGPLSREDRDALDEFLRSRVGAPKLVLAKATFNSLGCRGCHKIAGIGGDDGPELTLEGAKDPGRIDFMHVRGEHDLAGWLTEHFRSPATLVPGSQMPVLSLSEPQIDLLVRYMLSLRRASVPEAWWPKDRVRAERLGEREFAVDGATLYGSFCAACHGPNGEGMRYPGMPAFPAIGNPDFLAVASDEFLTSTITHGRPGRRMGAWGESSGGLRASEIATVVAHLRSLGGVALEPDARAPRWVRGDAAEGARLYAADCMQCHGAKGEGGEGPALANAALLANATDTYLFETIRRGRRGTTMLGFAQPSTVRPSLADPEIESIVTFLRSWENQP
ncbi:MAG: c-type cytochrome [Planctomycetes bacterium]|nr:c-type cytochrome [Planctomycetota bacterium]